MAHAVAGTEQIGRHYLQAHFGQTVDVVEHGAHVFGGVLAPLAGADGARVHYRDVNEPHAGVAMNGFRRDRRRGTRWSRRAAT